MRPKTLPSLRERRSSFLTLSFYPAEILLHYSLFASLPDSLLSFFFPPHVLPNCSSATLPTAQRRQYPWIIHGCLAGKKQTVSTCLKTRTALMTKHTMLFVHQKHTLLSTGQEFVPLFYLMLRSLIINSSSYFISRIFISQEHKAEMDQHLDQGCKKVLIHIGIATLCFLILY